MLSSSSRGVYEEGAELLPSHPHLPSNTPDAALNLAVLPSWASEQCNRLVSSCTIKKTPHRKGLQQVLPQPCGQGGVSGGFLGTETHRGLWGQEVPTHGDLLPGSATGSLPSPPLGALWPQALPAQPAPSAPGMGGRRLGSKPQTAKITLGQGKAIGGHDAGICMSRAALPRWITKEPKQAQACFPAVFASAEPLSRP